MKSDLRSPGRPPMRGPVQLTGPARRVTGPSIGLRRRSLSVRHPNGYCRPAGSGLTFFEKGPPVRQPGASAKAPVGVQDLPACHFGMHRDGTEEHHMAVLVLCRQGHRLPARLSLIASCLALFLATWPGTAHAGIIQRDIANYVVHAATRPNYFDGRLLTANDLNEEQTYRRSTDRYLGPTGDPLASLFHVVGQADVVLLFDEADALLGKRTDVMDSHDRYADDYILLDIAAGTWRGRLFLEEYGDIVEGVYDDVSGTFERLTVTSSVPEPTTTATMLSGVIGLGLLAYGRRRTGRDRRAGLVTAR
jgi:hypothetical protein